MRSQKIGLSLAALMFVSPFAACSGDDDPDSGDGGSSAENGTDGGDTDDGSIAGPEEPSNRRPDCPFTAKQLGKELGVALEGADCVFTPAKKSEPLRISVTTDIAADNESYEQQLANTENWANVEELDVDGEGFVAWTDDNLNIVVGYLDNAGAYVYNVSAADLEQLGAEDAVGLAEQLIGLTVEARPKPDENFSTETAEPEDESGGDGSKKDKKDDKGRDQGD